MKFVESFRQGHGHEHHSSIRGILFVVSTLWLCASYKANNIDKILSSCAWNTHLRVSEFHGSHMKLTKYEQRNPPADAWGTGAADSAPPRAEETGRRAHRAPSHVTYS